MSGSLRLDEAWRQAAQGIGRNEARLLLQQVANCSHAGLIASPERLLDAREAAHFLELTERRAAGEPLAYLLGSAWFAGLEFTVTPEVLIPRPETEVLVECAAKLAPADADIVDLGTGSGIIAILLAKKCPTARLTAVDISSKALMIARKNAQQHGAAIRFLEGDWYAPLAGQRFDLIVANPPYVAEGDPHLGLNGLPFEPRTALTDGVDGGDGTKHLAALIDGAPAHLRPGGWLLMEHGYDQAVIVRSRLTARGFADVASWPDAAGIERVSGGRFSSPTTDYR